MKKIIYLAFLLWASVAFAAPVITNVLVTGMTATTVTIQWNTDTASNSSLKYGTDPSLPYQTVTDQNLVTSHTEKITLLTAGPYYYVAAVSGDNSGTSQSSAISFSLCGSPQTPVQGTVTNYYEYGTYQLTWIPPAGTSQPPMVCGQAVTTTVTGNLDGGASFNTQVADASKIVPGPGTWQIEVDDAGNLAPLTITAALSQVTQNVSQQLQTAAATSGLQACLTNTITDASWPATCGGGSTPGVISLNSLSGVLTLAGGSNINLNQTGNTITINGGQSGAYPGGSPGSFQYQLNGTTFGGVNVSGIPKGNGTGAPSTAAGSTNGTGDYQLPITFACSGGINCTLAGNLWSVVYSGSAGSGAVNSANAYQVGCYPASGTTIGGCPNVYSLNPSMSLSQINTLFSSLTAGQDVVIIPPGTPQLGFSNHAPITTIDLRAGASLTQLGGQGAACDAQPTPFNVTLTAGSNLVNVGALDGAAQDVGKVMTFGVQTGYLYNSPQYFWTAIITAYSNPNFTLSANAPFPFTGRAQIGTDNTANIQSALNNASSLFPLSIPSGCRMLVTQPLQWNNAQSIIGQQMANSGFVAGGPIDILQQPDTAGQGSANGNGVRLQNVGFVMESSVDPTRVTGGPLTTYNSAGTPTVQPALYRPIFDHMGHANDPCAPGWVVNCANGVASITQNSAVICTPNSETPPAVGQQIMFPYFVNIFTSTVSSTSGSCSTGFTARTMAAALPNTSGYTVAQAEWFTGAAIQSTTTTIPTTINYPLTITLTLPTSPIPGFESNFAQSGHIKVCGIEADYLGGSQLPPYTVVLRRGPTTTAGCTGTTPIAAMNPCPARNLFGSSSDQPWPVIPSINSGDSTPSGANWFPGACGGVAAISFPEANANVFRQNGLAHAYLENLQFDVTSVQAQNSTMAMYTSGQSDPYATDMGYFLIDFLQFGYAQGPAAAGQHSVAIAGPSEAGNNIHDWSIHAAFGLELVDFQQGKVNRVDSYGDWFSPYDGTEIGTGTGIAMGHTNDEQTGAGVTFTNQDTVDVWNHEPAGSGSGIAVVPYAELDSDRNTYDSDNFEAPPVFIGGTKQTFTNSNISLSSIIFGNDITIHATAGSNAGYYTNTWNGQPQMLNWGTGNICDLFQGGQGPSVPCGSGFVQPASGHSIEAATTGNLAHPYENAVGGQVSPGEWAGFGFDGQPMSVAFAVDPTEPYWGSYAACNLGGSAQCQTEHFDGFQGFLYIGPHQRFVDGPYTLQADFKMAAAASTFTIQMAALDSGTGQCASPGNLAALTVNATNAWTPFQGAVDFTGKAGCILSVAFVGGSTTDQMRVGGFNFVPVPGQVLIPTASPTVGSACSGSAAIVGSTSTSVLFCLNNVVVAGAGSSGITSLISDVTGAGAGAVATHVVAIGGGPLNFTGLMQDTAGTVSQATSFLLPGSGVLGTYFAWGLDTVTFSATPVFNNANGNSHYLTLTGNVTSSSFANGVANSPQFFKVCQDGTGGRTFSWPSNFAGFPSVTLAAGGCTTATGTFDFSTTTVWGDQYNAAQCVNAAASNVPCGAATRGYIAVPVGTNSTLTVLTSAVANDSGFVLTPTPGASTLLGATCNTTPPSLGQAISTWTAGTSFTVTTYGTTSTSPECYFWSLVNK